MANRGTGRGGRVLKVLGGVVLVLVLAVGTLGYLAFGGSQAMPARQELAPGVVEIKDAFVGVGIVATGPRMVALIDAGNRADGGAILAELAARGLTADAVTAIFLTHGHPDHRKGVAAFPRAAVYLMAEDVAIATGAAKPRGPLPRLLPNGDDHVRITRTLRDGETVRAGSAAVRVFALPGHMAGSAAFLVDGVLFLGDGAMISGAGALTGPKWLFSDNTVQGAASLRALAGRLAPGAAGIKVIATSHAGALSAGLAPLQAFAAAK